MTSKPAAGLRWGWDFGGDYVPAIVVSFGHDGGVTCEQEMIPMRQPGLVIEGEFARVPADE